MKKKVMTAVLAVALAGVALVGGTLAYFTDTDDAVNTFTVGNVKIVQNEYGKDGVTPFKQDQAISPIINAGDKFNDPNYVWKQVSVTNTGTEPAYIRTFIAIPMAGDNSSDNKAYNNWLHWNAYSAEDGGNSWYWDEALEVDWPGNDADWNDYYTDVDGKTYRVLIATHTTPVPGVTEAGEATTTGVSMRGFYLDSGIDCEILADGTKNYFYYPLNADGSRSDEKVSLGDISELEILVASQAVQSTGFVDTNGNGTAADEAFAASGLPSNPWAVTA